MRGILECWIKQAHRVELFKQRQSNQHALHCKFHLHTGEVLISFRFTFGKFSSTFVGLLLGNLHRRIVQSFAN